MTSPVATAIADLRPSGLLVGLSMLVIGGWLILVGVSLGAMASTFDPCSAIGGAVILPVPLALAVLQYRAVFHRRSVAAVAAACSSIGFGCLFALIALSIAWSIAEELFYHPARSEAWPDVRPSAIALAAFLSLAGLGLAAGVNTFRWVRQLNAAAAPSSRSFSLRELLVLVTLVGVVAGVARWSVDRRPTVGIDVPPEQAPYSVPPSATNVCYRKFIRSGGAVEFNTDEATFRKWVEEVVAPMGHHKPGFRLLPLTAFQGPKRFLGFDDNSVEVQAGLSYSWNYEDQSVSATFDSTTGRAYLRKHWH